MKNIKIDNSKAAAALMKAALKLDPKLVEPKSVDDLKSLGNYLSFGPEENLKATILNSLKKRLPLRDEAERDFLIKFRDEIFRDIVEPEEKTEHERIKTLFDSFFVDGWSNFMMVSGVASAWEFTVRNFAEKVGVELYLKGDSKTKKQKNLEAVAFRDLDPIISEILKASKFLNLNLRNAAAFRSSLVHGNFQELRQKFNSTVRKEKQKLNRGEVFVFSFGNAEDHQNLSDKMSEQKRESMNLFSWFMDCHNSRLMSQLLDFFEGEIKKLNILIAFHANCFRETNGLFDKCFFKGERLSNDDRENFLKRSDKINSTGMPTKQFLEEIDQCFIFSGR